MKVNNMDFFWMIKIRKIFLFIKMILKNLVQNQSVMKKRGKDQFLTLVIKLSFIKERSNKMLKLLILNLKDMINKNEKYKS